MDLSEAKNTIDRMNSGQITWDDNLRAQANNIINSGFSGSSGGGAPDYTSLARQQMQLQQEAAKPAVASLQAQIPTIQQSFQQQGSYLKSQVDPLQKRYESLISQIQGQQTQETNRTSTATANELGRRGISSQSGLYDQTVNQALNPINQYYAGQIGNVGSERESALAALQNQIAMNPIQQTQAEQAVQQAIAQLQAGGASDAITQAVGLYQSQLQAQQEAARQALAQQQSGLENQLQQTQLGFQQQRNPLELALLQAQLQKAQQAATTSELPSLDTLFSQFGG